MLRSELEELHYIAPMTNLQSICKTGILSHSRAENIPHISVAMPEIQERRAKVTVPGGKKLHEYVNLYICARNPMMYKIISVEDPKSICVLRVSTDILDLPEVVITDGNASSAYIRFSAAPAGLSIVDRERTLSDDWRDDDSIIYFRKKLAKCAEVLVPDIIEPRYIIGVYVLCDESLKKLGTSTLQIPLTINSHLFFR